MPGPRVAVLMLVVLACGFVGVLVAVDEHADPVPREPAPAPGSSALRVLHGWDQRRATAYATGSAAALRDLYVAGSSAGNADLRMLRAYRARAMRVTGMRMQVLALSVLGSRTGWRRLRVTDRLVGATAVQDDRRIRLPRDRASTRTLTMMRGGDGRWRVASVTTPAGSAGPA